MENRHAVRDHRISSTSPAEQEFSSQSPTQPHSASQPTQLVMEGLNPWPDHESMYAPTSARAGQALVTAASEKATQSSSHRKDGVMHACRPQASPSGSGSKENRSQVMKIEGIIVDAEECRRKRTEGIKKSDFYCCAWDLDGSPCGMWIGGEKRDIREHLQKWHGVKKGLDKDRISCLWWGCETRPLRKESLSRHIRSVHLGLRWKYLCCGNLYTREDAGGKHEHAEGVDGKEPQDGPVAVLLGPGARVINMHAALEPSSPPGITSPEF
jgi:hypothetical protein